MEENGAASLYAPSRVLAFHVSSELSVRDQGRRGAGFAMTTHVRSEILGDFVMEADAVLRSFWCCMGQLALPPAWNASPLGLVPD